MSIFSEFGVLDWLGLAVAVGFVFAIGCAVSSDD